jgi:hypothetical protein
MSACVLGVVIWKALEAKATTLERGETATRNLAHSLAEHASHTIRSSPERLIYPSIWVSPQIEIAWPEMVLPRGLHMNRIWSAICSGVT